MIYGMGDLISVPKGEVRTDLFPHNVSNACTRTHTHTQKNTDFGPSSEQCTDK